MNGSIKLMGDISWGTAPVQYQFSQDGSSGWHSTMAANDLYRRDSLDGGKTWGSSYQFRGVDGVDGDDANVPSYINSTYIGPTIIKSPTINGNNIYAVNAFGVGENGKYGSLGYATGKKIVKDDGTDSEVTTYGVAMAAGSTSRVNGIITYDSNGYYIIATDSGVRMQAPNHSITVTESGCFIDGLKVGAGANIAVFG